MPKQKAGRGAKGAGIRYENQVAKALKFSIHGPWFEFEDANGFGVCQPDIIQVRGTELVVVECKLSFVPNAFTQLSELYLPVLRKIFPQTLRPVVVCKILRPDVPQDRVYDSLDKALTHGEAIPVVHWLGSGPL